MHLRQGKRGAKPCFSYSEVMTLLLLRDFLPFPGAHQRLGFVRAHSLPLFPRLLDQSQFNRRARALRLPVAELRRHWTTALGATLTPGSCGIPRRSPWWVTNGARNAAISQGRPPTACASAGICSISATSGCCCPHAQVSRWPPRGCRPTRMSGRRPTRCCRCSGTARSAGTKGFLGADWPQAQRETQGHRIRTPTRRNQRHPQSEALNRWLHCQRGRIERAPSTQCRTRGAIWSGCGARPSWD